MSKKIWGGLGFAAALAATGVGAKIYADKNLAAYYGQEHTGQLNYQLKYSNYEMGAVSGSADVQLDLQRDPCKTETKMHFTGQDTIKRTWQGYVIDSKLQLQNQQDQYAQYLKQPIEIRTVINWAGMVNSTLSLPKIDIPYESLFVQIEPIQIKIEGQVREQGAHFKKMHAELSQISIKDQNGNLQLNDMVFDTDQGISTNELTAGTMRWKTGNIQLNLNSKEDISIALHDMELNTDTLLNGQTVDVNSKFKIGYLSAVESNYENIEFNFDFKALNRHAVENYYRVIAQKDKSCAASKRFDQDIEQAMLQMLNAGFNFVAENNKIATKQGKLQANLNAKIMPNYVTSKETLIQMFPSLVDAQMDLSLDKAMLKGFLQLAPTGKAPINDNELEMMLKALEDKGHIQREGQVIKMGMEYKYGKPNFNTFKSST